MQHEEPYSTLLYTLAPHPSTPSGLTIGRSKSAPVVIALPFHQSGLSSSAGTDLEIA